MNVIFLGPPGAGKGTQGALLSQRVGIPRIVTGDLLRAAVTEGTPLGAKAKFYMDDGLLVPDEVIVGLIEGILESGEAASGVIMDGFPRTVAQAEAVDELLSARADKVDAVITFDVPEDELVRRILGRAGDEGRSDDTAETIRRRLAVYERETEPVIDFYRNRGIVKEILGTGAVEEVAARVQEALDA